jgi:hypothetical protein
MAGGDSEAIDFIDEVLPWTAGADTSFKTLRLPQEGQAGAGSLILCKTV